MPLNHLLSVKVASVINHILQTGKLRLKKGGITCLTSHGQQVAELRIQGVPCWLCHMVSLQDSFIPTQKRTQVTQGRDTKTHLERHLGKDCWQREKRGLMDLSHPRLSLPSSPPLYFPPHTSFSRGENSHRDAKTHIDAPTRSDSPPPNTHTTNTAIHTSTEAHTSGGKSQDSRAGSTPALSPE